MSSQKSALLAKKNKYAPVDEEWIELDDMHNGSKVSTKESTKESTPYAMLGDQPQLYPNLAATVPKKPYLAASQPAAVMQPSSSMVNQPNAFKMNGSVFQKVGTAPQGIRKPTIPMMQVACDFCTMLQNVPGNTQVYICGSCSNMNQCYPLYGIFICGHCQTQVFYAFGTSEYIKCTKCATINKVPFEPKKKYIDKPALKKKQQEEEAILNNDHYEQEILEQYSQSSQK